MLPLMAFGGTFTFILAGFKLAGVITCWLWVVAPVAAGLLCLAIMLPRKAQ